MKIDPLKLTISDREVTFGVVGFRIYVDATRRMRENKEQAFSRVVASLARDPMSSATTAASAIDGYMAGMIISEYEVNQWLFSPEGEYFVFEYSLRRHDKDISSELIDTLYDEMSMDDKSKIGTFFTKCLMKDRYKEPVEPPAEEKEDPPTAE